MCERDQVGIYREAILGAFRAELENVPAYARGTAAIWVIEEAFKALAWTHGTTIAAELAYRLADSLVTVGRVER